MVSDRPKPPADLVARGPGRRLWREVVAVYDMRPDEAVLLAEAARMVDELAALRGEPGTDVKIMRLRTELRRTLGSLGLTDAADEAARSDAPATCWPRCAPSARPPRRVRPSARPGPVGTAMRPRRIRRRELSDADLDLLVLADRVEAELPDWSAFIYREVERAPTTAVEYLLARRCLRHHETDKREGWLAFSDWTQAMMSARGMYPVAERVYPDAQPVDRDFTLFPARTAHAAGSPLSGPIEGSDGKRPRRVQPPRA